MSEKSHWERYRLRYGLGGMFFLGLFGVLAFGPKSELHMPYVEHLFMAASISAFIAFFLELALHQQFAKNVFEAAIGYVLPEELRDELRWLYNQTFVCESHIQTTTVTRIAGTALVVVTNSVTRTFKNITADSQTFAPGLGVNEWFHKDRPTRITHYSCQIENGPVGANLATKLVRKGGDVGIGKQTPISVGSQARLTVSFTSEETQHENDWNYCHFGRPTANVSVTVHVPEDLDAEVRFSHRESDPKLTQVGPNVWQLKGVLLPLQGIRVYWRRKDLYEAWKQTLSALSEEE